MTHVLAHLLVFLAGPVVVARAQCPDWQHGFASGALNDTVWTLATHTEGSEVELIVGGQFRGATPLPAVVGTRILRWNGEAWSTFAAGLDGTVYAIEHYDSGSGSDLYVGGEMLPSTTPAPFLGRWNGSTWVPLGSGVDAPIGALCTFDDGTGAQLYAAGNALTNAGGVAVQRIARWNGTAWSDVGGGVDGTIACFAAHDDGTGPALYAGGTFANAGGVPAARIARWDGTTWSALGAGTDGTVDALASFGGELIAAGSFTSAGGVPCSRIARWDGAAWSALGAGTNDRVRALEVHDDGTGPKLYAGGLFAQAGGASANRVARWDGTSWSALANGLVGEVLALRTWIDHGLPKLAAGGSLALPGSAVSQRVVLWDGTGWQPVSQGVSHVVEDVEVYDDGGGARIWIGGVFANAGGTEARGVARWNGDSWTGIPGLGPQSYVTCLHANADPADRALYFAGSFNPPGGQQLAVKRWDGTTLSQVGPNVNAAVFAMAIYDAGSGPQLHIVDDAGVRRFNGTTWQGIPGAPSATFTHKSLLVFDEGGGSALYMGMRRKVARWNGSTWTTLGDLTAGSIDVLDLAAFDDGSGPALYLCGTEIGVARWNGTAWVQIAAGLATFAPAKLCAFDDGTGRGTRLFAGGRTGSPAPAVYVLDGATWSPYAVSTVPGNDRVHALATYRPSPDLPAQLWAAGGFGNLAGTDSFNLAVLRACERSGKLFCFGDGSAAACPCGNASAVGARAGCLHSLGYGGRVEARGEPSLTSDGVELLGSSMPNSSALWFQGRSVIAGGSGIPFGDGISCIVGPFVRLVTRTNSGGASSYPGAGETPVSIRGQLTGPGTVHYAVRYRNSAVFCTSDTFNYTNAVSLVWRP